MMKRYTAEEIRSKYLKFFETKGHKIIQSASVVPENDPTVLFTTAGMHPLVPYLLGEKHPSGDRLVNAQKCIRTGDIDEVGDATHCTFFEMLGNWSLGDYFKKESIAYSFEFLTSTEWLYIPKERLYFTVFEGDSDSPRDTESQQYWKELGVDDNHIFFCSKEHNWWGPAGITGPCGPDTEIFIDNGKEACGPSCSPTCDCGRFIEIWNNVFMEFYKNEDGNYEQLKQKNVDTGMGLERALIALNGGSVYSSELFEDAFIKIQELSIHASEKAYRIIADHVRCATMILGDELSVTPSNVDQGYVLRRLIRRAVRHGKTIGLKEKSLSQIAKVFILKYQNHYPELKRNEKWIICELDKEEERFSKTLIQGLREFEKRTANLNDVISGDLAFKLYDTFGFPIEITVELAKEKNLTVDLDGFESKFDEHRKKSQEGAEKKFKGGLADHSEDVAKLHTATHLLHAALRQVLGNHIGQKGSNITSERLRFDFNFERKMTPEEISTVEKLVNKAIQDKVDISCREMTLQDAKDSGAIGLFEDKYDSTVKVYQMGQHSMEICGGPHASNTGDLGHFQIAKEESSSSGVRRIKGILK
jgi:alanyl-tRNA synthetase